MVQVEAFRFKSRRKLYGFATTLSELEISCLLARLTQVF